MVVEHQTGTSQTLDESKEMSMSKLGAQTGGVYLSDEDKTDIFHRYRDSDAKDLRRQVRGMTVLKAAGGLLAVAFFLVNAYQGSWALARLTGIGNGTLVDQTTIIIVAAGLILAANVVAIRMTLSGGVGMVFGVVIVAGLMAFSVLTSAMHISFSIQSGVMQSARNTDEYKLAKDRYERANQALSAAQGDFSAYQDKAKAGNTAEYGWMMRDDATAPLQGRITGAQREVEAARQSYETAREEGGAEGQIIGTIAEWFGWTTQQFALNFSIFCVVLMEAVRVYLSFIAGMYLRSLMQELTDEQGESTGTGRQAHEDASGAPSEDFAQNWRGKTQSRSTGLESDHDGDHDNTPSWKRDATAQAQLARVRDGIRAGHLTALGVNNVAKFAHCGSDRAEWIRSELVKEGMAERNPSGRLKVSAAA